MAAHADARTGVTAVACKQLHALMHASMLLTPCNPHATPQMEVDLRRHRDLSIYVDVTFHAVPCAGEAAHTAACCPAACGCMQQACLLSYPPCVGSHAWGPLHSHPCMGPCRSTHPVPRPPAALSVDIIDASGTADSDVNYAAGAHLHKVRLGRDGAPAGEYATPQSQRAVHEGGSTVVNVDLGAAMQHMGEMEEEIGAAEGCRLRGDVTVRRVAGRLHFAVHQQSFIDKLPQVRGLHAGGEALRHACGSRIPPQAAT